MKAFVFKGAGQSALEEKPRPEIQRSTDVILRITKTTICGTDLHILKGDVPEVKPGRILGHEGVGIVEEIGDGVESLKVGDRVLISCITSCGRCGNCRKGMYSHCENGGGWILGHTIDGTQAEYVRIPFADTSLHPLPSGCDEESWVMLSDVLPTAYECGVLAGCVKPGDTVAIVGAGPIGLGALMTSQFYAPAEIIMIDIDRSRLNFSVSLGASITFDNSEGQAAAAVMERTRGRGVDVAIEAIGIPASFDICQQIVAAGGHIANVGVHGKPVQLDLNRLWPHNITLTTRLVDTVSIPMLAKSLSFGKLEPCRLISHHFPLSEIQKAYRTFDDAIHSGAIKVIIENDLSRTI